MPTATEQRTVRLSDEAYEDLRLLALAAGTSMRSVLNELIKQEANAKRAEIKGWLREQGARQ